MDEKAPARGAGTGRPRLFDQGMDALSKSPASPHGPSAALLLRAPSMVPSLFGYFFPGHAEKKYLAPRQRGETLANGETRRHQHDNQTTPPPNTTSPPESG